MSADKPVIPLCRSDFLQDFSIEFGRNLKPIRYASKSVIAEVDFCEHEGHSLERLAVWIQTWNYTRTTLVLWEDHRIWVAMELLPTRNNRKYQISFNPEGDAFSAEELVEALRGTSSVSTRLCYGESPVATLRRIWRHAGEVEIKGTLDARKRTKR